MSVHITKHAIARYQQRVAPVSRAEAVRVMRGATRAIEAAAAFGGHIVRMNDGSRLICTGRGQVRVVTVLERGCIQGGRFARLPQFTGVHA